MLVALSFATRGSPYPPPLPHPAGRGRRGGGYKHTEETKLNMKENYSDERREQIGSLNRGKKQNYRLKLSN